MVVLQNEFEFRTATNYNLYNCMCKEKINTLTSVSPDPF